MYVVGLMSGTSMDGIDAALVDIETEPELKIELISFVNILYSPALKKDLKSVLPPNRGSIEMLTYLDYHLGELFGKAALKAISQGGLQRSEVELVASHGHTVLNLPPKAPYFPGRCRLQIGDTAVIAEVTGITTVGDFRPAEVAAGGEGAPLIANFDYHAFGSKQQSRVVVNIGGIANVTYLPAGGPLESVRAFDVGPGNMIIDEVVRRITKDQQSYDCDGRLAAKGKSNSALLAKLLQHPFINLEPPKSAGREEFGSGYVDEIFKLAGQLGLSELDLVASVTEFTAESLARHCREYLGKVDELIVGGGGVYNQALMGMLRAKLAGTQVNSTEDYGISIAAKEAMGFAFLGLQSLKRRPNNVPAATGARHPVIMGKLSWGPSTIAE